MWGYFIGCGGVQSGVGREWWEVQCGVGRGRARHGHVWYGEEACGGRGSTGCTVLCGESGRCGGRNSMVRRWGEVYAMKYKAFKAILRTN